MILAIETYTARKQLGEEKAFQFIHDAGFDGIDYSFYCWPSGPDTDMLGEDYREQALQTKARLARYGLICHQAHAPFDFRYGDEISCNNPHYMRIVRSIEYASIIGVQQIVVHGIRVPEGALSAESIKYNYHYYKSLEPYCQRYGIKIAVENQITTAFPKPEHINEMLEMLDSPWFVACVDIGHPSRAGSAPENFISSVKPGALKALHIHDNDSTADQHNLPYLGKLNWEAILESLVEYGYDGEFTFEVLGFLNCFEPELLPHALNFAAKVGQNLIKRFLELQKH